MSCAHLRPLRHTISQQISAELADDCRSVVCAIGNAAVRQPVRMVHSWGWAKTEGLLGDGNGGGLWFWKGGSKR